MSGLSSNDESDEMGIVNHMYLEKIIRVHFLLLEANELKYYWSQFSAVLVENLTQNHLSGAECFLT